MDCRDRAGLSAAEVAQRLGISKSHFHGLRKRGLFNVTPLRLGRSVRFPCAAVNKWIETQTGQPLV